MADGGRISAAIRPGSRRHPSDARLRAVSANRHHTFTLAQLEAEGLSARAVRHRLATGRLERLHAGGAPALRRVLAAATEPAVTRSDFEEALFAALDGAGLPRPRVNDFIALEDNTGYHPDFLWPEAKLIVEADSQAFHASLARRRHDARRDRRLKLAGYDTFRWAGEDPDELIADVVAHLAGAAQVPVARPATWR